GRCIKCMDKQNRLAAAITGKLHSSRQTVGSSILRKRALNSAEHLRSRYAAKIQSRKYVLWKEKIF
ncbi:MAG TPA: hypothetical protein VFT06_00110, partial [Flavisolibacter sp.]|nr:hypothetical protein [Flavisolibacter sp.]